MSLYDDPFADMVKYDGACQVCHGDMRKCDGKCMAMEPIILHERYTIFELPADSTEEQFQMMIQSYQEKGYVIPGVITDYANGKIVIVARKPTQSERDAMNTPAEPSDAD